LNTTSPRFSVVVPTRERAGTLRACLRTCLDQTFDDYEVVVSDNASSPATRAAADEAAAAAPPGRVRYVRTPGPVAMSANWEFGVGHARGEYVLIIGDDDALLPHALGALDRLARDTGAKAIRWETAYYTWPDVVLAGQGNYLRVPLGRGRRQRSGDEAIAAVAAFREIYTELPMLYNAAVHRDVLAEVRGRQGGRVFPHPIPDVYSGFAVAHAAGTFLSVGAPMSVAGQSGASNGIAALFHRGRSAIDKEFRALNAASGLRHEPTVPDVPAFPHVPVADAFAAAKRLLFPELAAEVDRRELCRGCVALARVPAEGWPEVLAAVRASLADAPALVAWFDAELAGAPHVPLGPPQVGPAQLGFDGTHLHLDAAAFGVADVAGAAAVCDRVLNYRAGVRYGDGDGPGVGHQLVELDVQLRRQAQALEQQQAHIRDLSARLERHDRLARRSVLRKVATGCWPAGGAFTRTRSGLTARLRVSVSANARARHPGRFVSHRRRHPAVCPPS
jgi:hypothetical protein